MRHQIHTDADEAGLEICFDRILNTYTRARRHDLICKEHPVWSWFTRASQLVRGVVEETGVRGITTRWSVGQGRWATVPWIAMMDERETSRVSSGVYVIYLFRGDMTGVYLTINQGSLDLMGKYKKKAQYHLQQRAVQIRRRLTGLDANAGFEHAARPEFRANTDLAWAYEAGAVVHKLYERGRIPSNSVLHDDLVALLKAYRRVVPSSRYLGW